MAREATRGAAPATQAQHVLAAINARADWMALDQTALDLLMAKHGAGTPIRTTLLADTRTRWEFRDGSALVEQMQCLEVGFPGSGLACWCWEATGHEDACPERLGELAPAWRHGAAWLITHAGGELVPGLFEEPTLAVSYRTGRGARRAHATGPEVARLGALLLAAAGKEERAADRLAAERVVFNGWLTR
jgi:hypothetical protein